MTRTTRRPSCALALFVFALATSPRPAPAADGAGDGELPRIRLERVVARTDNPVYLTHDGAGRTFLVEKTGRVRLLKADLSPEPEPYLDLSKDVFVEYECGLLSIAFHPRFAENGLLYANYTAKRPNLKTFVSEFHADPKAARVDRASERVILTIDQPYPNHNGGQLQFGPADGMLYIGMGDGGNAHDPNDNGQNPRSLLGKMLRIDVAPREGYGVPKDNPFAHDPSYAPEIWATGMRNPWRFSFDRPTGLLYAADVGQETWEEIDLIEPGRNYGWRVREGMHDLHPVDRPPTTTDPIFEYNHNKTAASVTGGYVYRGKRIPALVGWYVFGDYCDGRVFGLKYEGGKVVASGLLIDPKDPAHNGGQRPTQPASFGETPDGELFLLDANGPIYRIIGAE